MPLMRAALCLLLVVLLAPLVHLVFLVPPAELAAAAASPQTRDALRTSIAASLAAVGIATVLGVPAGYVLARTPPLGRGLALLGLAVPLALPPVASGIVLLGLVSTRAPLGSWLAAHGLAGVDSLLGVALAEFYVSGSVIAIASTAAFSGVDVALEESARALGASPLRTARSIALPLALPGIVAGIVLAWLRAVGEYGATSILAYHPTSLPIELVTALSADGVPRALALSEAFALFTFVMLGAAALLRRREK